MNRRSNALVHPLAILAAALLATACGGGSSNDGPVDGQFFDTAVDNLDYDAAQIFGTTDTNGSFLVGGGTPIVFSVGDIELPSVTPATVLTPVEMVAGATDETNAEVINIARFFLTLDEDEDPSDGIQIPDSAHIAAVGETIPDWADTTNVLNVLGVITANDPVDAGDAEDHLQGTLLCLVAGDWSGTYTSNIFAESGTWTATVDPDGMLDGVAISTIGSLDTFILMGTVESNGAAMFDDDDTLEWDGTLTRTGSASGTWVDGADAGTFTGTLSMGEDCTVPIPVP